MTFVFSCYEKPLEININTILLHLMFEIIITVIESLTEKFRRQMKIMQLNF